VKFRGPQWHLLLLQINIARALNEITADGPLDANNTTKKNKIGRQIIDIII
jgi:hypothetical protein